MATRQRVDDLAESIRELRDMAKDPEAMEEMAALMAERMLMCARVRELQANDNRDLH